MRNIRVNPHTSSALARTKGARAKSESITSVRVKVTSGASKEFLREIDKDQFEVFVREPAQKNMANKRICEIIAAHYGAPIKSARIETGHRSRNKIIGITM